MNRCTWLDEILHAHAKLDNL